MKSSDIFDRLKKLTELVGFKVTDGSIIKCELDAYAQALSNMSDEIDIIFDNMFIDTADAQGLSLFADAVGLKDCSSDNIKQQIIDKTANKFESIKLSDFYGMMSSLLPNCSAVFSPFLATFSLVSNDQQSMSLLSQLIHMTLPCFVDVCCASCGKTFNEWESLGLTFGEYDSLNCPFSILDTMKGA